MKLTPEVEKQLARLAKADAYRKAYNNKPEVKEKRKEYMKKRAAEMREALALVREAKSDPEKAVLLGIGKRVAM